MNCLFLVAIMELKIDGLTFDIVDGAFSGLRSSDLGSSDTLLR